MSISFRHTAGFGKRIEYYIIGLMLKEGLDVYVPLVDDNAVDAIIRKSDGTYIEIQIKARSNDVKVGDGALFAAITHEFRENYYFVFYSERLNCMWILSSKEYLDECVTNKTGKNAGKTSIWFNGTKTDPITKQKIKYSKERYKQILSHRFQQVLLIWKQEIDRRKEGFTFEYGKQSFSNIFLSST
ncbi:hypothetical protein M4D58_22805 [Brevibacillus borstelensis]|uniref:hypothetical protein n=1 Tax=Brevibacillus borstelensis TaxID=45462 RepID=UPI001C0F893C|nr:hypothetical protein [Brevibacillus borstelensis]MCM3593455.1 hypothetical protein [Brevibacillus borstelensis]